MIVRPLALAKRNVGLLALGAVALAGSLACSSERPSSDPVAASSPDGPALEGTVAMYTARLDDGTSETQVFLRSASTENPAETRLWFDADPELSPGAALKAWGDLG